MGIFGRYRLGYQALLALAFALLLVAIIFGSSPIEKYVPSPGFFRKMLPAWVLIPLIWSGFVSVEIARRRIDRPFVAVRRALYLQRHWLLRGAVFMVATLYFSIAFTSLKTAIPHYVTFYADPWLAQLDRAVFGTDPWRLTHAVLGSRGTMIVDRIYFLWFPVIMLYVGWFCFTRNQALQLRGLLSYLLAWTLLGNLLALSLASVGPCFYEHFYQDRQFAPLIANLQVADSEHRLFAVGSMKYLLNSIGQDRFGAGISAMPSLHVTLAFLCFLVAREYARHFLPKLLAGLFAGFIFVGSVHLGWHYVSDGVVGIVAVSLIWWGTGRFVRWVEAREAAQAVPAPEPLAAPVPA
jgi:PAP2 superfamily